MIGGDFELLPGQVSAEGGASADAFSSGRAAFYAVLGDAHERFGVTSVLLPEYICGSVITCVEDAQLPYAYYPVGLDLLPDVTALRALVAGAAAPVAVLLVDYFGLTGLPIDPSALGDGAITVLDRSHSPYDRALPHGVDYLFATLRKALPVADGGFAVSAHGPLTPVSGCEAPFVAEKLEAALVKAHAEADGLPDDAYLAHGRAGERMLDEERFYECGMSATSARILREADCAAIGARRRENFMALEAMLEPLGIAPLRRLAAGRVPLFLPVALGNRDETRAALAAERVFCPVHWPWPVGVLAAPPRPESALWRNELSLVIDQRYGEHEMRRIAGALGRVARPF